MSEHGCHAKRMSFEEALAHEQASISEGVCPEHHTRLAPKSGQCATGGEFWSMADDPILGKDAVTWSLTAPAALA